MIQENLQLKVSKGKQIILNYAQHCSFWELKYRLYPPTGGNSRNKVPASPFNFATQY